MPAPSMPADSRAFSRPSRYRYGDSVTSLGACLLPDRPPVASQLTRDRTIRDSPATLRPHNSSFCLLLEPSGAAQKSGPLQAQEEDRPENMDTSTHKGPWFRGRLRLSRWSGSEDVAWVIGAGQNPWMGCPRGGWPLARHLI